MVMILCKIRQQMLDFEKYYSVNYHVYNHIQVSLKKEK